jgi:hypothetical protein
MDRFIRRPKSSYRVVTIGMHPSVAQFNGFYTLDGYLTNYSLSYKHQFRRIITTEFTKRVELRDYFDGWGNRCYVFSSELGLNSLCAGQNHYVLHNLQIDTAQLRAMGCEYVISAAYIENSAENGLRLEKDFFSPDSFWHIYLYYVLPPQPAPTEFSELLHNRPFDEVVKPRLSGAGLKQFKSTGHPPRGLASELSFSDPLAPAGTETVRQLGSRPGGHRVVDPSP